MKTLLMKRKVALSIYIVASLLFVISDLLQYSMVAMVFDTLEKQSIEAFYGLIRVIGLMILATTVIFVVSRLLRLNYMKNVILDLRMAAFESLFKKSYKCFAKESKEVYLSRLINDVNRIESQFFNTLVIVISNMGIYIVGLVILCVLDIKLGVGTFLASVICYRISKQFTKPTERLQEEVSKENEAFTLETSNTFNGLEIIKLGRIEEQFLNKNLRKVKQLEYKKFMYNNFTEIQQNALMFLGYLVMVGITAYLGVQIAQGLELGRAVFMYQMSSSLAFKLMYVLAMMNVMKSTEGIYIKLVAEDEAYKLTGEQAVHDFMFEDTIELRNVSFGYSEEKVFEYVNLRLEKGKKYLIKGASGTGKSTLMKLLGKMYDDYEGSIVVDGINYKTISEPSYNQKVAFIDQDVFLFEDSLRNNIALYQPVDEKKLIQVLKAVGLWELVEEKTEQLDFMILENGKNLSGGQRQRIAIARALVKDAEILFVDEGTSSLNTELGAQIEDLLMELPQTIIAISHRYYKGISEKYSEILEIQGGKVCTYTASSYFEGVNRC